MTHAARPLQLRRDRGFPHPSATVLARAARAHNPPRFAGATASASLTLPHSRERCPPRRPTTPPRSRARATWPRPGPFAEPRFAPPRASPGARHAAAPCASTPRVRPPHLVRPAPPRPRDIRRVASAPPRVTARERASRGVCHRNRPGDLADPTPRRDRADPDPPRRGRGAPPRDRATTRTPRGDPRAITDATPRVREIPPRRPLARFRPPRRRRRRALPSARPRAGRLRHVSRLRRAFPVSKAKKKKGGSRRDGRGRVELECARPDRPTRPTRSRDHPRADHLD